MIRAMQQSASDTVCRALIMGAVLGGIVWAAARYTTLPRLLIQQTIDWYDSRKAWPTAPPPAAPATTPLDSHTFGQTPHLFPDLASSSARPLTQAPSPSPSAQMARSAAAGWGERGAAGPEVRLAVASEDEGGIGTAAPPDRREQIEQRLETLGAVYMLLEVWGRDQRRYRFHCQVAFAGGAQVTRSFEANGQFPLQAMERVLHDVEAWRAQASFTAPSVLR